jgi:hypothetical protein
MMDEEQKLGTAPFRGYMRDPSHLTGIIVAFVAVTRVVLADIYCAAKLSGESKRPLDVSPG